MTDLQLPIPAGFFAATTTAVNDSGDVVGYAGSPNIDSHAILWRGGMAINLGVWPGGHYSVATGINNLGQIVGTGTVAGDNLDHALLWTVDEGGGGIPCGDLRFLPGALPSPVAAARNCRPGLPSLTRATPASRSLSQSMATPLPLPSMATRPNSRSTTRRPGNTRLSLLIPLAAFRRWCRHVTSAVFHDSPFWCSKLTG